MPARNALKTYVEDSYYHLYNRGVEKRSIFLDETDYATFLHLLKIYLSPPAKSVELLTRTDLVNPRPIGSVWEEVELIAFCLMPNHFHLLIRQKTRNGMTKLMRRVSTTYSLYFNSRYRREGTLFQGRYKAALIDSEEYLLHLSRYIHLNPLELVKSESAFSRYKYSSYPYFLGEKHANWVRPEPVLTYFHSGGKSLLGGNFTYREFVEDYKTDPANVLGPFNIIEQEG